MPVKIEKIMKIIEREKREEVVRLYKEEKHTIKEIMKITGVRSEQTIYAILDETHISRFKTRKVVKKISVGVDAELYEIIEKENPKNIAKFVCNMAKKGYYSCKATIKKEENDTDVNLE